MVNKIILTGRKKKALLVVGLFMLLIVLIAVSPQGRNAISEYREDVLLAKLIEASGAEFHAINVTGWVRVNEDAFGAGNPEVLVNNLAERLELSRAGRKTEKWENSFAGGARLEARFSGDQKVFVVAQVLRQPDGKNISHLMASFDTGGRKEARFYKQKLQNTLTVYGRNSKVAMTCSGKINGALDGEELLSRAEKMMSKAGASIGEETVGDNLVSLTGFSPRLSGAMNYAGREVNLNVALRRSMIDDATYVYVASPVILTEY